MKQKLFSGIQRIGWKGSLLRGFAFLVVAIWVGMGWKLFALEVRMLGQAFTARNVLYDQKKAHIDGPIYPFLKQVKQQTPERSSIAFLGPGREHVMLNYDYKAKYYLYPRKVNLIDPRAVDGSLIQQSDYLVWLVPKERHEPMVDFLGKLKRLASVFRWSVQWQGGHWAMGLEALIKEPTS